MSHNIKEELSPRDDRVGLSDSPDHEAFASPEGIQADDPSGESNNALAQDASESDQPVIATDSAVTATDRQADSGAGAIESAPLDPELLPPPEADLERCLEERDQAIAVLMAEISAAAAQRQRLERDISFRQAQAEALEDDLDQERATIQELLKQGSLEELLATVATQREQLATLETYIDNRKACWCELEIASSADKQQLRELEQELLARVARIEQLENRARQAEAEAAALAQRLLADSLGKQLDDDKDQILSPALEAERAEWQKHSETLRTELMAQSKRLAKDKRTIDRQKRAISQLEKRLAKRDRHYQKLKDQLPQQETAANLLEAVGDASDQRVATLQVQLGDARNERTALQQQLDDQIARNDALSAEFDQLQSSQASSTVSLGTAESKLAALSQVIADQEAELVQTRQALATAADAQDGALHSAVEAASSELRQRIAELETQLATGSLQQQVDKLTAGRNDADRLIRELQQQLRAREGELEVFRQRLGLLSGLKASIRDLDDRMPEGAEGDPMADSKFTPQVDQLLVCLSGGEPACYPINSGALTIGRTSDNDIQIDTSYVSRRHAQLIREGDETYIEDLHSKNGVYVNALRVAREKLKDGDQVTIGQTHFRCRLSANGGERRDNLLTKH